MYTYTQVWQARKFHSILFFLSIWTIARPNEKKTIIAKIDKFINLVGLPG